MDAATYAGRELGLEVSEARVLHAAFSVIVHLAPSPVVARVPVVLPPGLDEEAQRSRQAREPEGWEDVRDDRHGSMLANELAEALAIPVSTVAASWFLKLASVALSFRAPNRRYAAEDFVGSPEGVEAAGELARHAQRRDEQLRELFQPVLRLAAKAALGGAEAPQRQVELGVLRLRRRVEDRG